MEYFFVQIAQLSSSTWQRKVCFHVQLNTFVVSSFSYIICKLVMGLVCYKIILYLFYYAHQILQYDTTFLKLIIVFNKG